MTKVAWITLSILVVTSALDVTNDTNNNVTSATETILVNGYLDPTTTSGISMDDHDDNNRINDTGIVFQHFVAHNTTMTCTADEHAQPFNTQIRGVNLGGWMVLEPWLTPSLFYQFLGKGENTTAFDMYTFCQVLGPEEANRQLHRHWKTWLTEEIVQELADSTAVNSFRLPIGDFQFVEYGPYSGCVGM
jgi:glucan 1,3-beta-glucosidase